MSRLQSKSSKNIKGVLLALAAPVEVQAAFAAVGVTTPQLQEWTAYPLVPGIDVVLTGIGKSNAAGAVARMAGTGYRAILSIGIAGSLPAKTFRAGERVLGTKSTFADEGVETDGKFLTTADIGFPMPGVGELVLTPDERLVTMLTPLVDCSGVIATVSTCSGTDARAKEVTRRTGAICEAMEGAAVGLVARRLDIAFAEVRVISNTTGERAKQQWDIRTAIESMRVFVKELASNV